MKTITVKDFTWQELSKLKADLMHGSLDETIKYLLYVQEGDRPDQQTSAEESGYVADAGKPLVESPESPSDQTQGKS